MIVAVLLMMAGVDQVSTATSSFLKVDDLINLCEHDPSACVSYVEGASDMLKFLQATGSVPARYCTAPDVKLGALTADVVSFLKAHKEIGRQGAGGVTWAALTLSHGCEE